MHTSCTDNRLSTPLHSDIVFGLHLVRQRLVLTDFMGGAACPALGLGEARPCGSVAAAGVFPAAPNPVPAPTPNHLGIIVRQGAWCGRRTHSSVVVVAAPQDPPAVSNPPDTWLHMHGLQPASSCTISIRAIGIAGHTTQHIRSEQGRHHQQLVHRSQCTAAPLAACMAAQRRGTVFGDVLACRLLSARAHTQPCTAARRACRLQMHTGLHCAAAASPVNPPASTLYHTGKTLLHPLCCAVNTPRTPLR